MAQEELKAFCVFLMILFIIFLFIVYIKHAIANFISDENSDFKYETIQNISLDNNHLNKTILNEAVFSAKPYEFSLSRIFSTAHVIIRSNENCQVVHNLKCNDLIEMKKNQNSFSNAIYNAIAFPTTFSSENACDYTEKIPIHKEYCFAVKLNGQLEVEYYHVQLAYERLALFLAGILICYLSVKLKDER